jgi:rhamnogalacturonyl hydrolase YesR
MFERDAILTMMLKANAYQQAHPVMQEKDRNWERGTWYTGVMAAYRASGDQRFLQQAGEWGKRHAWQVGTERCGANKLFCVQTWLELYSLQKDQAMLQPAIEHLASDVPNSPGGAQRWYLEGDHSYADSLYGSPALVQLYQATGDKKYLEMLHAFWDDLCGELLDREAGLFYRDRRFIGQTTPAVKKILWSRGNGWVIGGLVRVLDHLPPDEPQRAKYVDLLRTMAAALAQCQGKDGLWTANLADPDHVPGPESSGTGFFLYGIAWGVRHKLLDEASYLPVLRKGWTGLAGCLSPEGKVLHGQPVGDRPAEAKREATHEYVTGTFLLAAAEMYRLADEFASGTARTLTAPVPLLAAPLTISDRFPRIKAPGTGRAAVQLTSGAATCYPLYYFAPTLSQDGRYLVYHRYERGEVQLWRLDLQTAESVQLTRATKTDEMGRADWRPWQEEPNLRGVADYRSAINQARGTVVYFDGQQARQVDLLTLKDESLFEVPADRQVQSQNCCSPDGKWFVYIVTPRGSRYGQRVQADVTAYDFDRREQRVLFTVDHACHHVTMYDNEHFFAHHPPGHMGMCFGDLTSGTWRDLRSGDPGVQGEPCHSIATAHGIAYEVLQITPVRGGLYDPFTRRRLEWQLPREFGYTHTGWDPSGRLWFWETTGKLGHSLWYMERLDRERGGQFRPLTGDWPTYSPGQRGHFHAQVTPDHRWILFTAGDPATKTDQVFLLDISDVKDTQGITPDLLSHTGANDIAVSENLHGTPQSNGNKRGPVADRESSTPPRFPLFGSFDEMAKASDPVLPPVRAVTLGPKIHWFGYYDKFQLDPGNRYLLCMELDFEHRLPKSNEAAKIGMVDLAEGDKWIELGESRAWCWQQGCMLQWRPGSDREVVWNDREGEQFVCRVLDVKTRQVRTLPRAIGSIRPDGELAVCEDFSRIWNFRPGYAYAGIPDKYADQPAPAEIGVWRMDLDTGESQLIVSVADLAKIPYPQQSPRDRHYVNHLSWSPDGKRFLMFNRWSGAGMPTRVFTADADGRDLRLLSARDASHWTWRDPQHVLIWAGNAYRLYRDDGSGELKETLWQAPNGHQTYLPGTHNEWIVTDTYPHGAKREQIVYLFHVPSKRFVLLGRFPSTYQGEWRCDAHPRVSRDGKLVIIDSPHGGNGRQQYIIDISSVIADAQQGTR